MKIDEMKTMSDPGKIPHDRKVGVFLCKCGDNISRTVDLGEVREFALSLPNVSFSAFQQFTCSSEGQGIIQKAIQEYGLNAVVVGCCTPKQYEEMYRECIAAAGLNPYLLEIVNLREQVSYPHHDDPRGATQKAKLLVRAAVQKAELLEPLTVKKAKISREVAVIGGGIAGINASLYLAKIGHKVHLIEKEPTIGGNMASLVKTFPTDDCAMCTLSPKMDEVSKNKNITLYTYSEVDKVEKTREGLSLHIKRKPRYVDEDLCTGCNKCTEVCPVKIPNAYDRGLKSTKSAIYKQFPAAVPNKFTMERLGIPPCRQACPIQQSAQGYVALVAQGKFPEALATIRRDNPLPTVCGRVCNHLCEDQCSRGKMDDSISIAGIKRFVTEFGFQSRDNLLFSRPDHPGEPLNLVNLLAPPPSSTDLDPSGLEGLSSPAVTDGPEPGASGPGLAKERPHRQWPEDPKKVAIIGGGPAGLACAHEIVLNGHQATIFEASPEAGGILRWGIPAFRLPPEYLRHDIDFIQDLGVKIQTGCRIGKDMSFQDLLDGYDAVFLSMGLGENVKLRIPGADLEGISYGCDILRDCKWDELPKLGRQVLVVGGGNAAIDTARTLIRLGCQVTMICLETRETMPAIKEEILEAEAEGIQIKPAISPKRFLGDPEGRVSQVECVQVERIEKDPDGRLKPIFREGTEFLMDVDNVILAIGNRSDYAFLPPEIEVDPRGLIRVDPSSYRTSLEKVYGGGDLITGPTSVVEAMSSGKAAARRMICDFEQVSYPERFTDLQGPSIDAQDAIKRNRGYFEPQGRARMPKIHLEDRKSFQEVELGFSEEAVIAEAKRCLNCGGCSDCRECEKVCEARAIDYFQTEKVVPVTVGALILATGFQDFDPSHLHYGYGRYKNVITQFQLARMMDPLGPTAGKIIRPSDGQEAKRFLMVQCVGSRTGEQNTQEGHPYCSRVCCMVALKHASLIKKYFVDEAQIFICNIDIRAFGKGYEEYYEKVKTMGVKFIKGLPGEILEDQQTQDLMVQVEDMSTSSLLEIPADLVVLSTATEPAGVHDLLKQLGVARDESGFVKEFHPKIKPSDTSVKNIFVCGAAQGPKDISDAIAQSGLAAMAAASYVGDGYVVLNPLIAEVDPELCRACGRCEKECEFQAVRVDEKKLSAEVEEIMCEGCGKCAVVCPTGALSVKSFKEKQLLAAIDGLMEGVDGKEAVEMAETSSKS
jgi:heterodisulfide reductase subunit A2